MEFSAVSFFWNIMEGLSSAVQGVDTKLEVISERDLTDITLCGW